MMHESSSVSCYFCAIKGRHLKQTFSKLIILGSRVCSHDRASGRVSETHLERRLKAQLALDALDCLIFRLRANAACRRHGAKIHVKPRDRNTRLYRLRAESASGENLY